MNIPQGQHYAALLFESQSIYHEGDERSRTHPGHGYPAYTEYIDTTKYIPFENEAKLKEWALKAEKDKKKYQIILVKPISLSFETKINFL